MDLLAEREPDHVHGIRGDTADPEQPGLALRAFSAVLWVADALLVLATLVGAPLLAAVLAGKGTIQVPARISPPYTLVFASSGPGAMHDGDPFVTVEGGRITVYGNAPVEGQESRYLEKAPTVTASVKVAPDALGGRLVVAAGVAALLGLAWLAVTSLRHLVRTAMRGDPFVRRNAVRLRLVALALIGWPVVTAAMAAAFQRTLDVRPAVSMIDAGPNRWACLAGAVGLLALAEVFAAGSRLRELERTTI